MSDEKNDNGDIEALKKELGEKTEEAAKYLANWQRAEADFQNYKKRAEQEKKDLTDWANAELIKQILPVVDDFELAFKEMSSDMKNEKWADGFKLVQRKLSAALEAQGLKEMKSVGELFDPKYHEAIVQVPGDEDKVIQEFRKGYMLKDKILRTSRVGVGKGVQDTTEDVDKKTADSGQE